VKPLLQLSRLIDAMNEGIGKLVMWFVLAAVLISAGNAVMRKAFDIGSNAFLEIQWYLFAAVFMLGSGYVFLRNAHVRIDFISSKLSKRTNTIIDILGIVIFTIPLSLILISLSWPVFERAWVSGVFLLVPLGFGILALQCFSELIKRIAFLTGDRPEPFSDVAEKSDEQLLLEELEAKANAARLETR